MRTVEWYDQQLAERRAVVAALTWEGWSAQQIAARLDVTARTVCRDRAKIGGVARPRPAPFSDDEYRRAQQLLDDGCSLSEVARTLGRDVATICRRFRGQGWTREQTGQFNKLVAMRHAVEGDA